MSGNSVDWASELGSLSDSDELMSMLINDVKSEKPEYGQLQESSKILLQPAAVLPYQDIHVVRDVEPGSSSCLTQNLQNRMITTGGCLMNPLGFPYRSQKHVAPEAAPSASAIQSSQQLIIMNDIPANKRGIEKIQEATEEAEQGKKMNKIKNRISAAKSRAKMQVYIYLFIYIYVSILVENYISSFLFPPVNQVITNQNIVRLCVQLICYSREFSSFIGAYKVSGRKSEAIEK